MSRSPRRATTVVFRSPPRTIWSRLRRFFWRFARALVLLASALGPRLPPPPPPPPAPTEQVVEEDGDVLDQE